MDEVTENKDTTPAGQMDDINIPLVAVAVAFFAALLAVTIVGLQAYIYNHQDAEAAAKTAAQDDPKTPLGAILAAQHEELARSGWARSAAAATSAPGATTSAAVKGVPRIPIDRAMDKVIGDYAIVQGSSRK